ncbi:MAG: hypothetical protein A2284_07160 [Deltaproteobacteria bacterium RIFOXYA12_FULL_61_11]|nr:MAG: hypothetical protein A2284_07160 [Deltaproteobacteria bacterium RIFOXYA12_FULL_61_11]
MSDQAIEDVEKERGGCLKPLLLLGVLVGLAFAAGVLIFGSVLVGPTELGVKTVQFDLPGFLRKGMLEKTYGPGYHWFIPFAEQIDTFDGSVQTFHMSKSYRGDREHGSEPLEIRTRDESTVTLEVMVLYQVDHANAWVYWQNVGKSGLQVRRLGTKVRDLLKLSLGQLGRDEFYSNAKGREAQSKKVVEEINAVFLRTLESEGGPRLDPRAEAIRVIDVLISDFHFTEEYEHKIRDKSLVEEEVTVQQAREKTEEQRAGLLEIKAKGEAEVKVITEEGEAEARRIKADADLVFQRMLAQGELALKLAEADGKQKLTEAFKGRGGKLSAALEHARTLEGLKVMVLSSSGKEGFNPLDPRKMLELYDVAK